MLKTSKTELKKLCSGILNKYQVDKSVGYTKITNKGEHDFLMTIFENHSEWSEKKGVGVDFISIINTEWKNKCFQLHRIDGTTTDISFRSCIENKKPTRIFSEACRNAVRWEIDKFRKENVIFGVTTCEITGQILTKENCHIDHYNHSFSNLVKSFYKRFFKEYTIDYLVDNFILKTEDGKIDTSFDGWCYYDETLSDFVVTKSYNDKGYHLQELFILWHNKYTHLRAVTKEANLSILK